MTIKTFDKKSAGLLQAEALAALQAVATKYGLSVAQHGGSVGATEFIAKFAFRVTDTASVEAEERKTFDQYCHLYGMQTSAFGQMVLVASGRGGQKPVKIVGLNMGRKGAKFPIKVQDGDKVMLYAESLVRKLPAEHRYGVEDVMAKPFSALKVVQR